MKKLAKTSLTLMMILTLIITSLVPAYAASYKTLRYGSRGDDVGTMQTMLNTVMGENIKVDEKFGPETLALLKRFQSEYGLAVDGVCGTKTWKKLISAYENMTQKASILSIGSGKYSPGTLNEGQS